MPGTTYPPTVVIIAAILILLFFGVMFLVMISYYNNRKLVAVKEKKILKDNFEKQLLQSRLEIQEQVFNNISQEIHDNVGQILSLAKVQVNIIDQAGNFDRDRLMDVKESIGRALTDLRDIAKSLSNQRIQDLRLADLIDGELQRIQKTGFADTTFDITGTEQEFEFQDKLILYRMVQECLQNIVKHAKASRINVGMNFTGSNVSVLISDNGKGFDMKQQNVKGNSLGLQNIISRAKLMKGKVVIKSIINEGTSVEINIPL
jgi:two-component system, NarL family, sensor kinase